MVGVGVVEIELMVGVISFVEVIGAVTFTNEISISWVAVEWGVPLGCDRATDPQAGKRVSITHATTRLLHTLAVYHKILHGC
jgi:hypothetical protein